MFILGVAFTRFFCLVYSKDNLKRDLESNITDPDLEVQKMEG